MSCLALRNEWQDILKSASEESLSEHETLGSERALVWRTMVMKGNDGASRYVAEHGIEQIVAQVERCLQRKLEFEIRQLLFVLAGAGAQAHGDRCCNGCGGCKLFELATSVLLHVPMDFDMMQKRP